MGGAAWLVVAGCIQEDVEGQGVKRDETPSYEAEPAPSTCRSPPPPVGDTQDHKTVFASKVCLTCLLVQNAIPK